MEGAWIELGRVAIPVVGALILAWFTRRWTDDRQERALQAEQRRLDHQLAHEREMADLAELRSVLEDAATALMAAFDDYKEAATALWEASKASDNEQHRQRARLAIGKARAAGIALVRPLQRIAIRMDSTHPAASAFVQAMAGHQARVHELIEKGPQRYAPAEPHKGGGEAAVDLERFVTAARAAVASKLPAQEVDVPVRQSP